MRGGQDTLADLEALVAERARVIADLDARERALVKEAREQGVGGYYSCWSVPWGDIAKALGISRQAVMKRHADALHQEEQAKGVDRWQRRHERRADWSGWAR